MKFIVEVGSDTILIGQQIFEEEEEEEEEEEGEGKKEEGEGEEKEKEREKEINLNPRHVAQKDLHTIGYTKK